MAIELGFDGLRNSGTFKLASATKSAIQADPEQIIGKVVTITGNYEVGYGSDGDAVFGVVTQIEYPCTNNHNEFLVTVNWNQTFEGISCAGTETAGKYLECNGSGGLKESIDSYNCIALGVDTGTNTCTVKIH